MKYLPPMEAADGGYWFVADFTGKSEEEIKSFFATITVPFSALRAGELCLFRTLVPITNIEIANVAPADLLPDLDYTGKPFVRLGGK